MKKILFYTDTPIAGGAEKQMLLLTQNLDKKKYEVKLVCSDYRQLDRWVDEFKERGFKVLRLKVWHKHDPRHYFSLRKILKREQPNILHVHVWNPASGRYAFWAAHQLNTEIVTTEHDPFALQGFKNFIKKKCLQKTAYTIAVSEANKMLLLELYPFLQGKMTAIHNGIDLAEFKSELNSFSERERISMRQKLFGASEDDFVILSVAALHPRKGLKCLIQSFKSVFQEHKNARLVIVGEGPQQKELQDFINRLEIGNKVMLLGYQMNIPKILKSADVFVLPSVKEAFGLVLLESMAAQLPIIASKIGGIPEIIINNECGILVEAGNSEALAQVIMELKENKALRHSLALAGYQRVKKFDAQVMAKKTAEIYDRVMT